MSRHRRLPTPEQWDHLVHEATGALGELRRHGPKRIELAGLAGKDFPGSLRRDGGRGGSAEGGPTAALALVERPDPLEAEAQLVRDACGALGLVVELAARMATLATIDETLPVLKIGEGDCQACGRYVPGRRDDRLRSGYCEAHYRRWCRAGRPDRGEYAAAVRGEQRGETARAA